MKIFLKEIRKQKGLSLEQLSKVTGHPRSTLSYIENNRVDPKISTLCDIAKALKISICELIRCK